MDTHLRQANAKAVSEGILAEKHLEMKTDPQKGTSIEGYVTIKTDDVNTIRYYVSVPQKTKEGAENRAWAGINTVMSDFKSIAEVGEAGADRVRANGQLNMYHAAQSNTDIMNYKCNFYNRVVSNYEPKATFDVEMYIAAIVPENDLEGIPTGRVIVRGWVPQYNNGIEPIQLVSTKEDAAAIEQAYHPGDTVNFAGDIVNARVEKQIPMLIGKPKIEVSYKNELVITQASPAYGSPDMPTPPYERAVIEAAIQERKNRIEAAKAQGTTKTTQQTPYSRPSASAMGRQVQGW